MAILHKPDLLALFPPTPARLLAAMTLHRLRPCRRLRFEALEDRRLLAIIADTFTDSFAQVSRTVSQESMIVTVDTAGHSVLFYHPNDELGYINPETGDLLFADYFPGTSSILVLDGTPNGNLSDLAGITYGNGQPVTADGGNTVFHRDGSIMRSGSTWTYDAGASLKSGSSYFWSNGPVLRSGSIFKHPNGNNLQSGNQLFYSSGGTFKNSAGDLFYPGAQTLRDATSNYFYEAGGNLENNDTIYYSNAAVMVDASGNVFNSTGTPSFTPFTRVQNVGAAEIFTHVSNQKSETTLSLQSNGVGSVGVYVTHFTHVYDQPPPDPVDLKVTYIDDATLLFQWASGGAATTGYRVAWATGVSAPGDVSAGVDVANNYYVVTGLTPGQKVSLRVATRDEENNLSLGAIATGTAGALVQAPQTGRLIASALDTTFAQVYDTVDKNIILTVDKNDNSFVWYYVNDEVGYVNIDNGDRLEDVFDAFSVTPTYYYIVPGTSIILAEVSDGNPFGSISQIPSGARYQNGNLVRNGDVYYHNNGAVLRSADGTWFYPSGNTMKNATTTFWPGSITMRSGTTFRYANNALLKSGANILYPAGGTFYTPLSAIYSNGTTIRNSANALFYETGTSLLNASNQFLYRLGGGTMIDSSGNPFLTNGSSASVPFTYTESVGFSNVHVGINVDRIGRYAIPVVNTVSTHILGGTVDYSVVPPPKPANLSVASATPSSVTFSLTTGGGTTQDLVYAYSPGATAPYTPDGGTIVSGATFTIAGLAPGQLVAVRAFARNSEGEFSPGVTAVGHALLDADFDADDSVDSDDLAVWASHFGIALAATFADGDADNDHDVDGPDFLTWQRSFGNSLPALAASAAEALLAPPNSADGEAASAARFPSHATIDAVYAGGDFASLYGERLTFRPLGKARWRRA